jgi:hypothetical protein
MRSLQRTGASFQEKKMKRILLTMLAVALLSNTAVAQDWTFAGVRVHSGKETINKVPTKYGYNWIRRDKEYKKNKDLFKKAAKDAFKSKATYIDFIFKSSKSYKFVAIYNIQAMASLWKGNKKKKISYYKFYTGSDESSIEKQVAKDSQKQKYVGVQRIELIDLNQRKLELNQQAENPVNGRSIE